MRGINNNIYILIINIQSKCPKIPNKNFTNFYIKC